MKHRLVYIKRICELLGIKREKENSTKLSKKELQAICSCLAVLLRDIKGEELWKN